MNVLPSRSCAFCPVCKNECCACVDSPDPRSFNASPTHTAFIEALNTFTQNAGHLWEAWQQLQTAGFEVQDDGTYPFAPSSFDDLILEIGAWQEAISKNWTGKISANPHSLITQAPATVWDNDGTDRAHLLKLLGFKSPTCLEVSRSKWAELPPTIREDITAAWHRATTPATVPTICPRCNIGLVGSCKCTFPEVSIA